MTFWSCRFLFHQFIQRDKAHEIIADTDALTPLSAALVRSADVDRLNQIMGCICGQFVQIRILMNLLDNTFLVIRGKSKFARFANSSRVKSTSLSSKLVPSVCFSSIREIQAHTRRSTFFNNMICLLFDSQILHYQTNINLNMVFAWQTITSQNNPVLPGAGPPNGRERPAARRTFCQ